MTDEFLIAWCACPNRAAADTLADALVERRLAACVTALPAAHSTYRWADKVEHADEIVLMIKTRADLWAPLEAAVLELHPYDVPELIATPIDGGAPAYLQWLHESTT
ncbi:MAG: divalent-cation tolerance protein CutA [Gammaproteobacteria bacterium]